MKMIRLKRKRVKTKGFRVDSPLNIHSIKTAATDMFIANLMMRSSSCCGSKFIIQVFAVVGVVVVVQENQPEGTIPFSG
jgi:hypothetical protein